jgi:hypothetical protein
LEHRYDLIEASPPPCPSVHIGQPRSFDRSDPLISTNPERMRIVYG